MAMAMTGTAQLLRKQTTEGLLSHAADAMPNEDHWASRSVAFYDGLQSAARASPLRIATAWRLGLSQAR